MPRPGSGTVAASLPAPFSGLTPRESAIANLLSRGLSNPVIADRLHLYLKTVANYVSIILLKVGAEDQVHDGGGRFA